MKGKMKDTTKVVRKILEDYPDARVNDIVLYIRFMDATGQSTDLRKHTYDVHNQFESISRARRKVQQLNPFLKGETKRSEMEEDVREWARETVC